MVLAICGCKKTGMGAVLENFCANRSWESKMRYMLEETVGTCKGAGYRIGGFFSDTKQILRESSKSRIGKELELAVLKSGTVCSKAWRY